jgi:hypothetical protein
VAWNRLQDPYNLLIGWDILGYSEYDWSLKMGGWTPGDWLNTAIAIFTVLVACFLAALIGAKSGEGVSASAELLQFFVIRCNVSCRRPSDLSKLATDGLTL